MLQNFMGGVTLTSFGGDCRMSLSPALLERLSRVPITLSLPSQTMVIAFACGQSLRSVIQNTLHRHTREECETGSSKMSPTVAFFPPRYLCLLPGNAHSMETWVEISPRSRQSAAQNCMCTLSRQICLDETHEPHRNEALPLPWRVM